jgi:Leucine rich repeat
MHSFDSDIYWRSAFKLQLELGDAFQVERGHNFRQIGRGLYQFMNRSNHIRCTEEDEMWQYITDDKCMLKGIANLCKKEPLGRKLKARSGAPVSNVQRKWTFSNPPGYISESICLNDEVRILDMSHEALKSLPPTIGCLNKLVNLNLTRNLLSDLPPTIGGMASLTEINLYRNNLTTLPESFGSLNNLSSLFLNSNQLTCLPESFGKLTKLRELRIDENRITTLPSSFGNLKSLASLYLDKGLEQGMSRFKFNWLVVTYLGPQRTRS